jgi:hypothetical protein
MLKEEKNEGHDIFARKTNNKMTICINACLHKPENKKRLAIVYIQSIPKY